MPQVVLEMSADDQKLFRELAKLKGKYADLEKKLKDVGKASETASGKAKTGAEGAAKATKNLGDKADRAFGTGRIDKYAKALGAGGALFGAFKLVSKVYEVWIQNMREFSTEAKKAQDQVIAFAALQEGGTKRTRVEEASALAIKYGIADRGEAFGTIQALQSALGDYEAGKAAAETVFAATLVGIPIEAGQELEVLGASQGQAPGMALARAYKAGELSPRDPATLAKAGPALKFFEDKDVGSAMAAVLSGSVSPDLLRTYVKAAGIALSKTSSKEAQETYKRLDVENASRLEKLQALAKAGIDTTEELALAGFKELRQMEALAGLVPNIAAVEKFIPIIREEAHPGLFAKKRAGVEEELPEAALARKIGIVETARKDQLAFGPTAQRAMKHELRQKLLGMQFRAAGIEQFMMIDLIDEEGRVGPGAEWFGQFGRPEEWGRARRQVGDIMRNPGEIEEMMKPRSQRLADARGFLENLRGGDVASLARAIDDGAARGVARGMQQRIPSTTLGVSPDEDR